MTKNVYEVLRQKEIELARLEKEVEALRLVAPLLSEEKEGSDAVKSTIAAASLAQQPIRIPQPAPMPAAMSAAPVARAAAWEDTAKRWP